MRPPSATRLRKETDVKAKPLKMEVKTPEERAWPRHTEPCLTFAFSREQSSSRKSSSSTRTCTSLRRGRAASPIPSHPAPMHLLFAPLHHTLLQRASHQPGTHGKEQPKCLGTEAQPNPALQPLLCNGICSCAQQSPC